MPRYAAIDIGSNSLRMEAAEVTPGSPAKILASEREVTRLGESVFRTGKVSPEAISLVCRVLNTLAQQYRKLEVIGVRAVATSAIRDASNQDEFLAKASEAIAAPVEIISGQEESRLIHLGVQSRWPHGKQRLLIIDVGGGSAEVIHSDAGRMKEAVSKPLGAVRLTEVFLKNDPPADAELRRMQDYIEEKLASAMRRIGRRQWDRVVATSGTASAVVSAINHVSQAKVDKTDRLRASAAQIRQLYDELSRRSLEERRKITGIGPKRAEIIIAGVAVLHRFLQDLQLPSLYYSAAGLRDGIIADLAARGVGRELSELDRDQRQVVETMARRYGVSLPHARKVASLANTLFTSLQSLHGLAPSVGKLLDAAAYLHDVGHYVSESRHHKHSYYLVANSDLPGFTNRERELIANLCRFHRKAMPATDHAALEALNSDERRALILLTPLLRIADNLDRSHAERVESLECLVRDGQVILKLDSENDTDLEQWAAERSAEAFREVYGRDLVLSRVKA
ncbi:MAG TPA: Ppx/GppA phosphatase family protein [Bryobacteraceae bacterium]|nr:Ppx/GppA phosphatase family protein [Bryobacteraceae bacterium]